MKNPTEGASFLDKTASAMLTIQTFLRLQFKQWSRASRYIAFAFRHSQVHSLIGPFLIVPT